MSASNLGRVISYPEWSFQVDFLSPSRECWASAPIRPSPHPSKILPMHHSLVILTSGYRQCHKSNNKKINNKSSAKSIPLKFPCITQWDTQHCTKHNLGVTHFCGKQWIPSPSDDHDYSFPAQESRLNHSVLQPPPDYQLSSQMLFLPQFHLQIGTVTMHVTHIHVEGTMFVIGIKCRGSNFNS